MWHIVVCSICAGGSASTTTCRSTPAAFLPSWWTPSVASSGAALPAHYNKASSGRDQEPTRNVLLITLSAMLPCQCTTSLRLSPQSPSCERVVLVCAWGKEEEYWHCSTPQDGGSGQVRGHTHTRGVPAGRCRGRPHEPGQQHCPACQEEDLPPSSPTTPSPAEKGVLCLLLSDTHKPELPSPIPPSLSLLPPLPAVALRETLLRSSWSGTLAALTLLLEACGDEMLRENILKAHLSFIHLCGRCGMTDPRDAFLTSLCQAALPGTVCLVSCPWTSDNCHHCHLSLRFPHC